MNMEDCYKGEVIALRKDIEDHLDEDEMRQYTHLKTMNSVAFIVLNKPKNSHYIEAHRIYKKNSYPKYKCTPIVWNNDTYYINCVNKNKLNLKFMGKTKIQFDNPEDVIKAIAKKRTSIMEKTVGYDGKEKWVNKRRKKAENSQFWRKTDELNRARQESSHESGIGMAKKYAPSNHISIVAGGGCSPK